MNMAECNNLIDITSKALGIDHLLTEAYKKEIYNESEGHPYVIKVLLGEVAKAKSLVKIQRIIATKDEVLDALFERTYTSLSPAAKRVFMTLCNWRSVVPVLALEAVLMRPENDRMDVGSAVDELSRSSFIEVASSTEDNALFIMVPLAAALFGSRKISVDPAKTAIEIDTKMLQYFGATQSTDVKHGVKPRVDRLFRQIADKVSRSIDELDKNLPMLEFIARKYPPAWILIASLYEETNCENCLEKSIAALRKYLENKSDNLADIKYAWERIATLSRRTDDIVSEIHSLVELSQITYMSYNDISDSVNRINAIFKEHHNLIDTEEKKHIIEKLIKIMEDRSQEADATDCSRLAWLFLNVHDEDKAKEYAAKGLQIDPYNDYCNKLVYRFSQ